VHYGKLARVLKEAEDYAIRLLAPKYGEDAAGQIARRLVHRYSEHGFSIDPQETSEFMDRAEPTPEQASAIDELEDVLTLTRSNALGRLIEGGETEDEADQEGTT
jgi:hypothetical protein